MFRYSASIENSWPNLPSLSCKDPKVYPLSEVGNLTDECGRTVSSPLPVSFFFSSVVIKTRKSRHLNIDWEPENAGL